MKLGGIFFNVFGYRPFTTANGRQPERFQQLLQTKRGADTNTRLTHQSEIQQNSNPVGSKRNHSRDTGGLDLVSKRERTAARGLFQEQRINESMIRRTPQTLGEVDTLARWRLWLTRQQLDALSSNPSSSVVWEYGDWTFELSRSKTGFDLTLSTPNDDKISATAMGTLRQSLEQTLGLPVSVSIKN